MVIKNTEEKPFVRKLAIEELKKLDHDLTSFILEYMDDIEEDILSQPSALVKNNHVPSKDINFEEIYKEHWTCSICGKNTHMVNYDYLSGTDHLQCVLEKEQPKWVENDERMDIIGQNGNDGLHYSETNKNQTELEL